MKQFFRRGVQFASVTVLVIALSSCSFLKKDFEKQPIGEFLDPDITSVSLFRLTPEMEKLFDGYVSLFKSLKKEGKSFEEISTAQRKSMYAKLGMEEYLDKNVQADFEKNFYLLVPKSGFFNTKKFLDVSQSGDETQALENFSETFKIVFAYELKQDQIFGDFYDDLVKSLKKQSNLKVSSEKYEGSTIYNVQGGLAEYLITPDFLKELNAPEEIVKNLNTLINSVSFTYTGNYVFVAFKADPLKEVLKKKDANNEILKQRLKGMAASQGLVYAYSNAQSLISWYKDLVKIALENSAFGGDLTATAKIEAVATSEVIKLPQYVLSELTVSDGKLNFKETLYKDKAIVEKNQELAKVPVAYESKLSFDKVSNVLFSLDLNDVNGQIAYIKSLVLATGLLTTQQIQEGLNLAALQIPIFNVLKSDLKAGNDFSIKLFVTYDRERITDQPMINFLFNSNDSAKTFKDVENAVAIYNKGLQSSGIRGSYDKPAMKYQKLSDNFAKISLIVNDSLSDFVKEQDKDNPISEGQERSAAYIGSISDRNLIYVGVVGSQILDDGQPKESFERIFSQIKDSSKAGLEAMVFTNAAYLNASNIIEYGLKLQNMTREELLELFDAKFKSTIVSGNQPQLEAIGSLYTEFFEKLLRVKDVTIGHQVKDALTSDFWADVVVSKEKIKRKVSEPKNFTETAQPETSQEKAIEVKTALPSAE